MPFVDSETTNTYNPRAPLPTPPPGGGSQQQQAPATTAAPANQLATDSVYDADQANYKQAYDDAMADINYKRGSNDLSYGFNPLTHQLDTNSHGQYMQMFQHQGLDLENVMNMARNRGFDTGSGAVQRGEQNTRFDQRAEHDQLDQGYQDSLHGFDMAEKGALGSYNTNKNSALAALIARNIARQQATPPTVAPVATPATVAAQNPVLASSAKSLTAKGYDPWAINILAKAAATKKKR